MILLRLAFIRIFTHVRAHKRQKNTTYVTHIFFYGSFIKLFYCGFVGKIGHKKQGKRMQETFPTWYLSYRDMVKCYSKLFIYRNMLLLYWNSCPITCHSKNLYIEQMCTSLSKQLGFSLILIGSKVLRVHILCILSSISNVGHQFSCLKCLH